MNQLGLIFRLLILLILSQITQAETVEDTTRFNYKTVISFIHYRNDGQGGYIYAKPKYEPEPRSVFVLCMQIINKYQAEFGKSQTGMIPLDIRSLPVKAKLTLINPVATQDIFIGDHWLGDGKQFAIMEDRDFRRLVGWLKGRMKVSTPTSIDRINGWINSQHRQWEHDPESFSEGYFYPDAVETSEEQAPPQNTSASKPLAKQPGLNPAQQINPEPRSDKLDQLPNRAHTQAQSETSPKPVTYQTDLGNKNSGAIANKPLAPQAQPGATQYLTNLLSWQSLCALLLIALLGWRLQRGRKGH